MTYLNPHHQGDFNEHVAHRRAYWRKQVQLFLDLHSSRLIASGVVYQSELPLDTELLYLALRGEASSELQHYGRRLAAVGYKNILTSFQKYCAELQSS